MFVNILGRIQQWTGIVQNKLGTCKNEVDNLRKELLARACEIDVKTRELKNIKAGFAKYQNDLLSNGELPKKSLNKKYKLEPNEQREASIREDLLAMEDAQATNAKKIMRATRAADEDEEDAQAEKEIKRIKKINAQKNAARAADQENAEDLQLERAVDQTDEEEEETRDVNRIDEEDEERAIDRIIKTDEDEEESLKRGVKKRKMKDIAYTNIMIQTDVQEKERIKRESELESEVKRLRKEYDRVVKERAQYESAIQRALLRGVSSLNVEALRVLRCPPISCCTPCAPCPATTGIIPPEPVVLCPGKIKKKHSKSAIATVNSVKVSRDKNIQNGDQTDCTTKRPSTSICYSVRNQKSNIALMRKKCSDGSMVFLLHQGDARNLNISDKVCGSTIIKKIEIPPLPKFSI